MSFGVIGGSVASAAIGGILGGVGGGKPATSETMVQDLPAWMKPYYTGGEDQYGGNSFIPPPLTTDSMHWNTMGGRGYANGPPPPMFANDPRYTGQNVYDAPNTFIPSGPPGLNLTGSPVGGGQPGGMGGYMPPMGGNNPYMEAQKPNPMGPQNPLLAGQAMSQMPWMQRPGQDQGNEGTSAQGLPLAPGYPDITYPSENRPQTPPPSGPAPAPAPDPASTLNDRDWMRLQTYLQPRPYDGDSGRIGGHGLNYLQTLANQAPDSANPFGTLGPAGLSSGGLDWLRGASNQDFGAAFPGMYRGR